MSQTIPHRGRLQLPPEVLGKVLDDLDLEDIFRASHVSCMWRREARAHPTYCSKIYWNSDSKLESSLEFFLDRLSAHPAKPIHLHIFLGVGRGPGHEIPDLVFLNVILPAVKACLHRLIALDIGLYDRLVPDLFATLTAGPAPALTFLSLSGHGESPGALRDPPTLPLDLFRGHAPKLSAIDISSFRLPPTPIAAFANVRNITHTLHVEDRDAARELHPERFFINCPRLEELNIWANGCDLQNASWAACPPAHTLNLRRLYLTVVEDALHTRVVVQALCHPAMESVRVDTTDVDSDTLGLLLSHLDDSAQLTLEITGRHGLSLFCTFHDESRARSRTLLHNLDPDSEGDCTQEMIEGCMPELVPKFAMTADRIARLELSDHDVAWNFFLAIFPDTTLALIETLELTLCRESISDIELDAAMRLPSLRRIELIGNDPEEYVELDVDEVAYLMGSLLGCVARRELQLTLVRVTIVSDLQRIWGYFKRITIVPCD